MLGVGNRYEDLRHPLREGQVGEIEVHRYHGMYYVLLRVALYRARSFP